MEIFKIKIADVVFELHCLFSECKNLCKDYLVDQDSFDYEIFVNEKDIVYEREKSIKEAIYEGLPVYDYPDSYLETLSVYRKIANLLIERNICVFHGAVIAVDNEAYLFTAKSGTGKTTHINLWLEKFKDRAIIVNGDKPLLKIVDDKVYACGTPWAGKEGLNTNTILPLKAICILNRDVNNHIEEIDFKSAFDMLMQQIYKPKDSKGVIATINVATKLGKSTKLYSLGCNMDKEAADVAYEGMK